MDLVKSMQVDLAKAMQVDLVKYMHVDVFLATESSKLISLRDSRRGNSRLRGTEASRPRGFETFQTYEKMLVIQTFIRKASDGIMLHLND